MEVTANNKLKKLVIVGDRVLINRKKCRNKQRADSISLRECQEMEKIQSGYVMKVGPGYPIPVPMEEDEPWKDKEEQVKYVPLQAKEGDLAIFLQKGAFEVLYEGEKYFIVPQASILLLEREENLLD